MSLFFKSYKLAKIFDEKYKNHYISQQIYSQWGKDLHEFPQFNINKLKFEKLRNRSRDMKNIKYFVNQHFKNQILKSICVIIIEQNGHFVDYQLIERKITLFLRSFRQSLKELRNTNEMKHIDDPLFHSLMDYIDGYLVNTYTDKWKTIN